MSVFGTSFYVQADVGEGVFNIPFIIDTGAAISILPEQIYNQLPANEKPVLQPSQRPVCCGNDQSIRIRGIAFKKIRIQDVEYEVAFHVSPDMSKGILGMEFLDNYGAQIHIERRQLSLNNRNIKLYDVRGLPLRHRVVAARTMYLPPGQRVAVPARILGKHDLPEETVMVEGVQSTLSNSGVLVAKVVTRHDNYRVMIEVHNMTEDTRQLNRNVTLGIVSQVDDIKPWVPEKRDDMSKTRCNGEQPMLSSEDQKPEKNNDMSRKDMCIDQSRTSNVKRSAQNSNDMSRGVSGDNQSHLSNARGLTEKHNDMSSKNIGIDQSRASNAERLTENYNDMSRKVNGISQSRSSNAGSRTENCYDMSSKNFGIKTTRRSKARGMTKNRNDMSCTKNVIEPSKADNNKSMQVKNTANGQTRSSQPVYAMMMQAGNEREMSMSSMNNGKRAKTTCRNKKLSSQQCEVASALKHEHADVAHEQGLPCNANTNKLHDEEAGCTSKKEVGKWYPPYAVNQQYYQNLRERSCGDISVDQDDKDTTCDDDMPALVDVDDSSDDEEEAEEVLLQEEYVQALFEASRQRHDEDEAGDEETWSCEAVCKGMTEVPTYTVDDLPEHMRSVYSQHAEVLTDPWAKFKFFKLLQDHHDVFAKDRYDLGRTDLEYHHIDTGDEPPVRQKARRLPQVQHEEIENQVRKLADAGIITPSNSNYASNVLLVKKKDQSWRLCIDYRELNNKTKHKDPYLIPRIDDTLDALSGARYFCTLDLAQGYHQVELSETSKEKTAFITPHMSPSLWEFTCMPFGITGGPATFQRVMDRLLKGMAYKIALAYLDDIIVYGMTFVEVMNRLARVFSRIRMAGLKLKPKKCTFFQKQTLYLGHVVSEEGVQCDPDKIEKVKTWPRPRNGREALRFLGFCNYYNRFIKDFSRLAKPLYALGPKKAVFKWGQEEEESFEQLKAALISAPVMAFPTPNGDWILDTDASGTAMGAVLSQLQPNADGELEERVIAYGSKALQGRQQRYCTRRRELLAVVHFVGAFRPYLYGRFVTIRTDHASLKYLKTLNNPDDQFARWLQVLEETYYKIEVRKGSEHVNADAMSRLPVEECQKKRCICEGVAKLEAEDKSEDDYRSHSAAFDMPNEQPPDDDDADSDDDVMDAGRPPLPEPVAHVNAMFVNAVKFTQKWTAEQIATAQQEDPDIKLMYQRKKDGTGKPGSEEVKPLSEAAKAYFHDWQRITLEDNQVLYRRWETADGTEARFQIVLPTKFRDEMFTQLHSAINAGHMGRRRTQKRMQKKFYWFRMNEDIKMWVKICPVCQKRKKGGMTPKAPLKPMTVGMPNERVALDIVDHLPESEKGNVCVLMMIDHFSKYAKAVPLPNQTSETIATAFIEHWVSIFGTPVQLHTDQGRNFESTLIHELCQLLKIDKTRTTPYHPSGNGQCERQNSTAMNLVHSYASQDPYNWDKHLSLAMMGYNGTKHATTGFEPNRLMLGKNINMPADLMMPADPTVMLRPVNEYVVDVEKSIRRSFEVTRERLQRAATTMSNYHDRDAKLYHYDTGDCVKLRITRIKKGMKFVDKYEGPYYVIDQLGLRTFRIAKSAESKVMVRHHNHLLPYYPTPEEMQDTAWTKEKAREFREWRTDTTGTQTESTACQNDMSASSDVHMKNMHHEAVRSNDDETENEHAATAAMSQQVQTDVSIEADVENEFEAGERWWEIDNAICDLEEYQELANSAESFCIECQGRACGMNSRSGAPAGTCKLGWREFIDTNWQLHAQAATLVHASSTKEHEQMTTGVQTEISVSLTQSGHEIMMQTQKIHEQSRMVKKKNASSSEKKNETDASRVAKTQNDRKSGRNFGRKEEKTRKRVLVQIPVLADDLQIKRRKPGRPRKSTNVNCVMVQCQTQSGSDME